MLRFYRFCDIEFFFIAVTLRCEPDIIAFLLQSCNANAVDNENCTALDLAKITNQIETAKILQQHNAKKFKIQ